MIGTADRLFLHRAIELAARGLYSVSGNPRVGCVIVRDGEVLGRGWHECAGGLRMADAAAKALLWGGACATVASSVVQVRESRAARKVRGLCPRQIVKGYLPRRRRRSRRGERTVASKNPTPLRSSCDVVPEATVTAERRLDDADDGTSDSREALADEAAEECFGDEENARKTAGLIASFVSSWERHKHNTAPADWLATEFRKYPSLWKGEEEMVATAKDIVANVERRNADQASLHAHVDAGKSKASWLAGKIEAGAAAAGALSVGAYATNIEQTLQTANVQMLDTVTTASGTLNQGKNLDGLIAEQHHADTFNLDAVAKGSSLRAEVRGSLKKNSVDIVIKDSDGKIVRRYQSKYGKDAQATQDLLADGDYRGQRKLVPSGQEDAVANSTDAIEAEGVRSKPLSKDEAKQRQEQAQQEQEIRQYEWNDVNRIEIAKRIGKQAAASAALTCAFQGARILGRRVWNSLRGKENQPASEDLQEFFDSSIKGAAHVGVQTAVSGAVVVAVKNGLIKSLKNTPAGRIVEVVHLGMENAKVFWKFAKGDLTAEETLDAIGTANTSAIGGLAGAAYGIALGGVMGPVGIFVGGIVGGIAGSKIGEAVWKGSKAIVKAATKAATSALEGAIQVVKHGLRMLNPLNWAV